MASQFLLSNKQQFLHALQSGKGEEWTVVMGNEAADLDSIACAIAYSYLAATITKKPTVALIQIPRADLALRPENLEAFSLASLDPNHADLLCLDDLPDSPRPSRFALVDHNRLTENFDGKVVAVIDHHEDEGLYKDANPRKVAPVGSCSSLVAEHFRDSWDTAQPPPEIATLLLCALLVDTKNLKDKDKTTQTDIDSVGFLVNKSTLAAVALANLTTELEAKKESISHLSTRDLLRRDYKEYEFNAPAPTGKTRVGLTTVPLGLKQWQEKDPHLWKSVNAYMDERNLRVLGVLNSFKSETKGKHRRQIALVVEDTKALTKKLWDGLEKSKELDLQELDDVHVKQVTGRQARVWKQGNVKANRKIIAPLLREIIEN